MVPWHGNVLELRRRTWRCTMLHRYVRHAISLQLASSATVAINESVNTMNGSEPWPLAADDWLGQPLQLLRKSCVAQLIFTIIIGSARFVVGDSTGIIAGKVVLETPLSRLLTPHSRSAVSAANTGAGGLCRRWRGRTA